MTDQGDQELVRDRKAAAMWRKRAVKAEGELLAARHALGALRMRILELERILSRGAELPPRGPGDRPKPG